MADPVSTPVLRMRKARGWSQKRTAALADISFTSMRNLEHADIPKVMNMSLRTICRLALVLDCAATDICPFLGMRPRKRDLEFSEAMKAARQRPIPGGGRGIKDWQKDV